jgi:membrane protease subunit HflC
MRKGILIIVGLIVLLYVVFTSFVTVDPTVFVYVTQFGRPEAIYDGGDNDNDAGLHLRLPSPIQSVQRLDRRLQVFDLPGIELLTRDRSKGTIDKTLTIDAYVCWRIADKQGVDLFIRKVGTLDRAQTLLGQRISSQLAAVVGEMSMDDLVSVEQGKVDDSMKELRKTLLASQRDWARAEYGIKLVDIRIRRVNYPEQVRATIFDRIKSERATKAAEYQRQATTQSAEILSSARKKERIILADARAKAERLRGDALAEGDRIRNAAHRQERDFYKFLKKLDDYGRILGDSKTILYLSTQRELFDVLLNPNNTARPADKPEGNSGAVRKGGK